MISAVVYEVFSAIFPGLCERIVFLPVGRIKNLIELMNIQYDFGRSFRSRYVIYLYHKINE